VQSSLNRRKKKRVVVVVVVRLSWHAVVDCHFPSCSLLSHCAQLLFGVPRRFLFHPPAAPHFPQVGGYNNRSGWWLIHPLPLGPSSIPFAVGWGREWKKKKKKNHCAVCCSQSFFFPKVKWRNQSVEHSTALIPSAVAAQSGRSFLSSVPPPSNT
jgi:hypothetical protein